MRAEASELPTPAPLQQQPALSRRTGWSRLWPVAAALAAGALNVFAFAPFGVWPLQIACTALLFALVMRAPSVRAAALLGWMYSFTWTAAGVWWLYISLHDLGGLPAVITVAAIALLALGLGLIVGLATGGARWLQQRSGASRNATLLLILPALWMLAEWTRSWIFTGFPWLSTGYAHTAAPLAGFAALIGVYGVGWCAALVAAAIVLYFSARAGYSAPTRPPLPPLPPLPLPPTSGGQRLLTLLLIVGPLLAGQTLRSVAWTTPQGQPITVRLLQGNMAQEMKFDQSQLGNMLGVYQAMITAAPADLIATPETAVPVTAQQVPPDYLPGLANFARQSGSHLLIGMPISDSPADYTNGLLVYDPRAPAAGPTSPTIPTSPTSTASTARTDNAASITSTPGIGTPYRYDKHHLVPFGEFIPHGFHWFVALMHIPLGDLTRGAVLQPPFPVRDQWVLPNICYEDLFGEEIAAQIRARSERNLPMPTMLLNISNIAWFGDSIALPQHLQISQMRTLETGRPMLRATNTGATAVIGAHGQVQAELQPFTRGVLSATVQGYGGLTPFIRFGNTTMVLLAALLIGTGCLLHRRRR